MEEVKAGKNDNGMKGTFGRFGGQYVAETLMGPLDELEEQYEAVREDPRFWEELGLLLRHFVGRPTPITYLRRLSDQLGGARIYAKREDLAHTGAHKINNALGQALLARRMGKHRVIAETGAGQHGVATATVCCMLGMKSVIYMGAADVRRQEPNVQRMKLLGADVRVVHTGTQTLKDASIDAIQDWTTNARDTYYLLGSAVGPHPYPTMVRDFQSVIGDECRDQVLGAEGRLPACIVACVGGGSNAIGMFKAFLDDRDVRLIGVQAAGDGLETERHAAPLVAGSVGVLLGTDTYILQDDNGQIRDAHSIAPGLDYPGVGPQHSQLKTSGRVEYVAVDNKGALRAFRTLCQTEGIIPALEPAHAVAKALDLAPEMRRDETLMINMSGRGDKDLGPAIEGLLKYEVEV